MKVYSKYFGRTKFSPTSTIQRETVKKHPLRFGEDVIQKLLFFKRRVSKITCLVVMVNLCGGNVVEKGNHLIFLVLC